MGSHSRDRGDGLSGKERGLLEALPAAIELVDLDGRVVFSNQRACALLGAAREERIGRRVWESAPTRAESLRLRQEFLYSMRRPHAPEPRFHRARRGSRGIFPLRLDWSYRRDLRGRRVGAILVLSDASDREGAAGLSRGYSRSIIAAQEEERARIARELHDGVCQLLAAAKMTLPPAAPKRSPAERLSEPAEILAEAIAEVRRIIQEVYPAGLDDGQLAPAIEDRLAAFALTSGLKTTFRRGGAPPRLTPEAAHSLYRILQEALENVRRHARSRRVAVFLRAVKGGVRLSVRDDGRGFRGTPTAEGVGLRSIRHRAELLGGSVELATRKGAGTTVSVFLPAGKDADDGR